MEIVSMCKANFLLTIAGGIEYIKFKKATKNPKKYTQKTLRSILTYAKDTVYGKEHDFAYILQAQTDKELFRRFQEKVPTNQYTDLQPYIERHKHGESDVLFPGKPLLYATTSGTTASPKWIPITEKYFKDTYGRRSKLWFYFFVKNRPKVFSGKSFSIVGKAVEGYAPDGTIFGSVSGFAQGNTPKFVKDTYTNPAIVYSIADYNARYYVLMRMGIEQDVTLIVSVNPSTMIELQKNLNKYFDDYVIDIENGTLTDKINLEPEIRAQLEPLFKPNPKRAAALRALKEKYTDITLKHYWPNLQVITTWKCANTRIYLDEVAKNIPEHTYWHEFSYYASECAAGLAVDEGIDTCLFPHLNYFEFVEESEIGKENPRFYQLYELEAGKRYCIYVTTFSGLYRYNMNDLLEVGGKFNNVYKLHLIGKIDGIVSITGEKLSESQFIDALHQAEEETGIKLSFGIGFLDINIKGYRFYYEFADDEVSTEQMNNFNTAVDTILKNTNIEYAAKRDSLRLEMPIAHRLQRDSFEKYKAAMIAEGSRDGQFKLQLLSQDEKRHDKFKKLVK